ncbi:MAG TPA: prolipoprotein diacylglyceryl transferase [Spirochaetes bacterium]|mgnify:CR=1 FL=1|nr:prolipoprotein diacylglyceryl transferase [Spirochaetota bacterium]
MYPILFQYKFISIGGYGLMLGLGFYLAYLLFERELKLRDMDPELAYKILLAAIPGGIVGSKLFHILEHMDEFAADPAGMLFSGAGLSVYGGFILSMLLAWVIVRKSRVPFLRAADIVTPSLALGYCFGRFGCHVAGDGCYGIDTASFVGTAYPNGIVPTTATVYPTPLFEVFFSFLVFLLMMRLRKREMPEGRLFFIYLVLYGLPRFLVEFIRLNPRGLLGLTQAQFVGILLVIGGIVGWMYTGRRKALQP